MIITTSEEMRNLTGSYYANNDFSKIENIVNSVEQELCGMIGIDDLSGLTGDALLAAKQAIAFMASMRYFRLNDISHEHEGRKVKIDKENEARPFEWQLARDDRAHLEEYYRALDRLTAALQDEPQFKESDIYKRQQTLIVTTADTLVWLTGADNSPWLYLRLVPFLAESQRFVEKAYGDHLTPDGFGDTFASTDTITYAAQKAVALGAIALMGRRLSLQAMPYGLMKIFESDGGGNRKEAAALDRLDDYLKHLSHEQRYWIEEMKQLRDKTTGIEQPTKLQMPENDPHNKFMRL